MLITHEREKLINVIIFFATKTKFLGKTKLYKLLYFLDFDHYKEIGRSVTGLEYYAWPMGPVPVRLHNEVNTPERDLSEKIEFVEKQTRNGVMLTVKPICEFDAKHFTKREMRIMQTLVEQYADAVADDMVEATHLENQPWHKIFNEEGKRQKIIPYDLAINKQEFEEMKELISEREDFIKHLA